MLRLAIPGKVGVITNQRAVAITQPAHDARAQADTVLQPRCVRVGVGQYGSFPAVIRTSGWVESPAV